MKAYKVTHSSEKNHTISFHEGKILIDNTPVEIDMSRIKDDEFHFVMEDHSSITAKIISKDYATKRYVIEIDGSQHELLLQDSLDMLMDKMGLTKHSTDKMNDVLAPMPGLVLKVLVEEGQEIQKGDALIILEAMKMENIIKATGVGVVKRIAITMKQAVEKNQLLIEIA